MKIIDPVITLLILAHNPSRATIVGSSLFTASTSVAVAGMV
jgi:hypothetical protein